MRKQSDPEYLSILCGAGNLFGGGKARRTRIRNPTAKFATLDPGKPYFVAIATAAVFVSHTILAYRTYERQLPHITKSNQYDSISVLDDDSNELIFPAEDNLGVLSTRVIMLQSIQQRYGEKLRATDGEIGHVIDFYLDNKNWAVRYLVADTGGWLAGRLVLISPNALGRLYPNGKVLVVNLTRRQIENSPSIDEHKPVSRQHEE